MEQANNTFNKGLLIDINPMVLGNDSLTDCLNGTLITMNGNEVILQNDMGNRRVDNAFLPSGYEPIGIKEYGGIIYIAAYNPITNKSQIGSFPSPLKKINSDITENNSFDFNKFFSEIDSELILNCPIEFIKNDSFLIPLTNTPIHSGDKFAIYSSGLNNIKEYLTNYNNTSDDPTKAITPKNKKYTILVGILNSNNEFVDITRLLYRWKNIGGKWQPVQYDNSYTDVYKFNDGYFIADELPHNLNEETIADNNLIRAGLKMAINTYSYKLIGPMYLKFILNHIENFNYNIYGTYDNNIANIKIEGYIIYNCPDGATPISPNNNQDYKSFDEGIPSFSVFDLYDENCFKNPIDTEYKQSIYNYNSNTYTTKITKSYVIETENPIYNFFIGVLADKDTKDKYLKGLSVISSIDLNLLGSGKVSLDEWRFYNTEDNTKLTFSLNAYPEPNKSFKNLRFKFQNIDDSDDIIYYPKVDNIILNSDDIPIYDIGLPVYNGRLTIDIDWESNGFKPKKVYAVSIYYDIVEDEKTISTKLRDSVERWLLTTKLFNEFYSLSNGVSDFCSVEINPESDNYNERFAEKLRIPLTGTNSINTTLDKLPDVIEGSLISKDINDIKYECKHLTKVTITNNSTLDIDNKDLYPDYVSVSNSVSLSFKDCQLESINNKAVSLNLYQLFINELKIISGEEVSSNTAEKFDKSNIFSESLVKNKNKIELIVNNSDLYIGTSNSGIKNVSNVFNSYYSLLNDITKNQKSYFGKGVCGIGMDNDQQNVFCYQSMKNSFIVHTSNNNSKDYEKREFIVEDKQQENFSNVRSNVFEFFNKNLPSNQLFTFLYTDSDNVHNNYIIREDNSIYMVNPSSGLSRIEGDKGTRLWMRGTNENWALFNQLLFCEHKLSDEGVLINYLNNNLEQVVKNGLNYNYIYCMYDSYDNEISHLHATDKDFKYYDEYNIILKYKIDYEYSSDNISDKVSIKYQYGNLKFYSDENISNNSYNEFDIVLKSSENFVDSIKNFNANEISGIDLETGLLIDSEGRKLDKNCIYYNDNGQLVRLINPSIVLDYNNKTDDGKNLILYNCKNNNQTPEYFYDAGNKGLQLFYTEGVTVIGKDTYENLENNTSSYR